MGYNFSIYSYFKLKPEIGEFKDYLWPCESNKDRIIRIYNDDILTKKEDGKYMKHTGLCCFGIVIPNEDLDYFENKIELTII